MPVPDRLSAYFGLCVLVICRSQARAEVRGEELAPQYTCEHIWWTTHGLVQPGLAAVLAGTVREWVTRSERKGFRRGQPGVFINGDVCGRLL